MAEIPKEWLYGETLGPREVARIFDVDSRTVSAWASNGVIGFFRTPHGMRRFPECEVQRVVAGGPAPEWLKEYAREDAAKYKEKWLGGWHRAPKVTEVQDGDQ